MVLSGLMGGRGRSGLKRGMGERGNGVWGGLWSGLQGAEGSGGRRASLQGDPVRRKEVGMVEDFAVAAALSGRVPVVDDDASGQPTGPPAVGAHGHDEVVTAGQHRHVHRGALRAHETAPGTRHGLNVFGQLLGGLPGGAGHCALKAVGCSEEPGGTCPCSGQSLLVLLPVTLSPSASHVVRALLLGRLESELHAVVGASLIPNRRTVLSCRFPSTQGYDILHNVVLFIGGDGKSDSGELLQVPEHGAAEVARGGKSVAEVMKRVSYVTATHVDAHERDWSL